MDLLVTLSEHARLLLVLASCYLAGACLFSGRGERDGAGLAVVWFVSGACLVSFSFLLSKVMGTGLIVLAVLPLALLSLYAYRKPDFRLAVTHPPGELGWALALCVTSVLPVLIMGLRMGAGEYPAEFFAADSPYFLHQVYALAGTRSYPPPSFETYGLSYKYHYGLQAFVALASLASQLKPHLVLFAIVVPLLEILTGLLIYDIGRRLSGRHGIALAGLFVVLFGSKQYLVNYLDPAAWEFATRVENFNFAYAHAPSVAGLLISLCVVRCALAFDRRNLRLAALFLATMLPLFKVPFLIPVGAGLALVYFRELRKQFNFTLLLEIAGAGLLSLANYALFAHSAMVTRADVGFNVPGFLRMTVDWQDHTLAVLATLVIITAVATRQALSEGMTRLLMFAIAPYLVFLLFSFENGNERQIFDVSLKSAALFAAVYFLSGWFPGDHPNCLRRAIAVAALAGVTAPAVVSLLNHVYVVAFHPGKGHEYTDNRSVADALGHIPLENTLIATNDLRYPADGYSRDYRQFQLAGLFGHRNLATNLVYGGLSDSDRSLYVALVRLFQQQAWPAAQIDALRQKVPITHLLIHKHYRHANDIPLRLVYENRDYAVYRF